MHEDPDDMSDNPLEVLREVVVGIIAAKDWDVSLRELGVFLLVGLHKSPHTVRGLARTLAVSTSAATRALDVLDALKLTSRRIDPNDRRSKLVELTAEGRTSLRELNWLMRVAELKILRRKLSATRQIE